MQAKNVHIITLPINCLIKKKYLLSMEVLGTFFVPNQRGTVQDYFIFVSSRSLNPCGPTYYATLSGAWSAKLRNLDATQIRRVSRQRIRIKSGRVVKLRLYIE